MHIVDRQTAKLAGLTHYFTGGPCKRGHVEERYVNSSNCIACDHERCRRKYEDPGYRERDNARRRRSRLRRLSEDPTYREYERVRSREHQRKRKGLPEPTHPEPMSCELCGTPTESLNRSLCLDHDHETGKFRGWLCGSCNKGLGLLGDTLPTLQCAIEYLRRT